MRKLIIEKNIYFDSVYLMLISKEVRKIRNVKAAIVAMGTETNVGFLREIGFSESDMSSVTPNHLMIAVEAMNEEASQRAMQRARDLLKNKKNRTDEGEGYRPGSFDAAFKILPNANLAIISVPGMFAAEEAKKALRRDLHVMLFSDNVSIEDEIELKKIASRRGLLMMGPDCGTAILNGKPLGFANVVRRGEIGIVGASGTGIQEICSTIDRMGGGISQAIGTGGRDLHQAIGGMMTLMGIEALKNDSCTKVIVVISKAPQKDITRKMILKLEGTGKPCVLHFVGFSPTPHGKHIRVGTNLEETARMAIALLRGESHTPRSFSVSKEEIKDIIEGEISRMKKGQKYLRGLFTGGTLAEEAIFILGKRFREIYSNNQATSHLLLRDPHISQKHTIIDLGDDLFTKGKPHPMIDPSAREARIYKEMEDPEIALFLLDVVLGYGSHEDPAGAIIRSLERAKKKAEKRGGHLSVIASVTGTGADFQDREEQKRKLERIGCIVMPSNAQASLLALKIMMRLV